MRNRYIGEEVEISPTWNKSKVLWVTCEQWDDIDENGKTRVVSNPSFWFEFDGWMYYGICEYEFGFLEQYEDWQDINGDYFNNYVPTEKEFNMLVDFKAPHNKRVDPNKPYKTKYYKLEYEKAMQGDLDHWCQFEIDFTTEWNRDKKIKDIGI